MARILVVGTATLDIIQEVDRYPDEDSEQRAADQAWRVGGNAANTATVLSQLGHDCAWVGVLSDSPAGRWIGDSLRGRGIDVTGARLSSGQAPVSSVILNRSNGSRTIVHFRDLPELDAATFAALELAENDWVHFEGRNVAQLAAMIKTVRMHQPAARISLEVEKPRKEIEALFSLPDLLLFSRAWASYHGFGSAHGLIEYVAPRTEATIVCAWGDAGAWAAERDAEPVSCGPYVPDKVIDTLGAGDVFNAAVIHGLQHRWSLAVSLEFSCRLAGCKCGYKGLDKLEPCL